jgi:hypothetical protein
MGVSKRGVCVLNGVLDERDGAVLDGELERGEFDVDRLVDADRVLDGGIKFLL